ncbi:MAG: response regulator [Phototrophicaceae bacterium]|jgi:DNA-binding response OmpR family regulator
MTLHNPQLLIVEDDHHLLEMLQTYLQMKDYQVMTASWGDEALALIEKHHFDLVLLDIRLPDMNGYDICRNIRSHRQTRHLPIIFLTEKSERFNKIQGLELGVVDYITKPFDMQELQLRIRNAIKRADTPSSLHPITQLPSRVILEEHLHELLNDGKGVSLIGLRVHQLDRFREHYGFSAADDVMRAISLIIRNALRSFGAQEDLAGHLQSTEYFAILTTVTDPESILRRIEERLEQSSGYFYPTQGAAEDRLRFEFFFRSTDWLRQVPGIPASVDDW